MRNILIKIAYDGSCFFGYQLQAGSNVRTVQGELQSALCAMHKKRLPEFHAAGRTDRGVHAEGQYINVYSALDSIPAVKFAAALNTWLPDDLRAVESRAVSPSLHARYSAVWRLYRYTYCMRPVLLPQHRNFASRFPGPCSIDSMNKDVQACVGTHDFTSFCRLPANKEIRTRTVRRAEFVAEDEFLHLYISANGFLRGMVRAIVGTVAGREVQRQRGKLPSRTIEHILQERNRTCAGMSAAPQGLTLMDVEYDE